MTPAPDDAGPGPIAQVAEILAAAYLRFLARRNRVDLVAESEPHGAVVDGEEIAFAFGPSPETEDA